MQVPHHRAETVTFLDERMSSQAAAVAAWRSSLASADAEAFAKVKADLATTRSMGDGGARDGAEAPAEAPQPGPPDREGEQGSGSGDGA